MLRVTRSAMLESTEGGGENNVMIGKRGKDFEFNHLHPLHVEFVECAAGSPEKTNPQLSSVEDWLTKIA